MAQTSHAEPPPPTTTTQSVVHPQTGDIASPIFDFSAQQSPWKQSSSPTSLGTRNVPALDTEVDRQVDHIVQVVVVQMEPQKPSEPEIKDARDFCERSDMTLGKRPWTLTNWRTTFCP
jgi:hypothetical protein